MSRESLQQALPTAIRKAADVEPSFGQGWTVRIDSRDATREVRLGSQAQVARLTLELERLGFVLQVDDDSADFVFALSEAAAAAG